MTRKDSTQKNRLTVEIEKNVTATEVLRALLIRENAKELIYELVRILEQPAEDWEITYSHKTINGWIELLQEKAKEPRLVDAVAKTPHYRVVYKQ